MRKAISKLTDPGFDFGIANGLKLVAVHRAKTVKDFGGEQPRQHPEDWTQ